MMLHLIFSDVIFEFEGTDFYVFRVIMIAILVLWIQ